MCKLIPMVSEGAVSCADAVSNNLSEASSAALAGLDSSDPLARHIGYLIGGLCVSVASWYGLPVVRDIAVPTYIVQVQLDSLKLLEEKITRFENLIPDDDVGFALPKVQTENRANKLVTLGKLKDMVYK